MSVCEFSKGFSIYITTRRDQKIGNREEKSEDQEGAREEVGGLATTAYIYIQDLDKKQGK